MTRSLSRHCDFRECIGEEPWDLPFMPRQKWSGCPQHYELFTIFSRLLLTGGSLICIVGHSELCTWIMQRGKYHHGSRLLISILEMFPKAEHRACQGQSWFTLGWLGISPQQQGNPVSPSECSTSVFASLVNCFAPWVCRCERRYDFPLRKFSTNSPILSWDKVEILQGIKKKTNKKAIPPTKKPQPQQHPSPQ